MDQDNAKPVLPEMMHQDAVSQQSLEDLSTKELWLVWTARKPTLVMRLKPREVS
jgi:hypothetical protein